jgi:hypothetical protein
MSEIDGIPHLRVGIFFGLPVYQPLAAGDIGYRNPQDGHRLPPQMYPLNNVDVCCLLIGGGAGEHPAIIFRDVEHAVARYIVFASSNNETPLQIADKAKAVRGDLQTIDYCNWRNEDHIAFRKRCESIYNFHADTMSFETWLLLNVGEFLFHVIPSYTMGTKRLVELLSWEPFISFQSILTPYSKYDGNGKNRFLIVDDFQNRDTLRSE